MMFVSGEAGEASAETTGIIEEIVRQQVIEIVCCILIVSFLQMLIAKTSSRNATTLQSAVALVALGWLTSSSSFART